MSTTENKQTMQNIFLALSRGDDSVLINAMSDDIQWNWMGTGRWSRSFVGKASVVNDLFAAAKSAINQPSRAEAHRMLADGEYVVVESTGHNTTPGGKSYNNRYCWVCRFNKGKLVEINEYMDTELVTQTFIG